MKTGSTLALGAAIFLLAACARDDGSDPGASSQALAGTEDDVPLADEELPPDDGSGDTDGAVVSSDDAVRANAGDTIEGDGVDAIVPDVDTTVSIVAELDDGTWKAMRVEHRASGVRAAAIDQETLHAVDPDDAAEDAPPSACSDRAFTRMGHRWNARLDWRFRSGSTPSTNAASRVERSLAEAAANVARAHNDCGVGGARAPAQRHLGRTRRNTNIIGSTTRVKCGRTDGRNVVGFGVLPPRVLGVACTWSVGGVAVEADVKLNDRNVRWFTGNGAPGGCQAAFSVEGISTHEFGHVYGLGHVSEGAHGNLTMSTQARPCTGRDASLGRGDVLGLRKIYGP